MRLIGAAVCLVLFLGCTGSPCSDISGNWRNELGSNMTIDKVDDGSRITGRFYTAVETYTGAARTTSKISGLLKPVLRGSLVAFNVIWNGGKTVVVWVGQCSVCDGKPKLYTTWLLTSLESPYKRWMSTRINQNTFYRVDDFNSTDQPDDELSGNSDLVGKWTATCGDSFTITNASESGYGLEGSQPGLFKSSTLYGEDAVIQNNTALAMVAVNDGLQIRGWAGYIYNGSQVIETSWLTHGFSWQCKNPRSLVKFGMDNYSKESEDNTT